MRISIRSKTILGIALVEVLFLSVLIINSIRILSSSHENELAYRAETLANVFSNAVSDAVLSLDLATLYSLVDDLLVSHEVLKVEVANPQRILINKAKESITVSEDIAIQATSHIQVNGAEFGYVRVWIDSSYVNEVVSEASQQSIQIAIIEIGFVALASVLLGIYLTSQLARLKKEILKVESGDLTPSTSTNDIPNDEIGDVIGAFEQLKKALSEAEKEREGVLKRVFDLASENQKKEIWLKLMINQLVDGVVVFDADGQIQYANEPAHSMFGYEENSLPKLDVFSLPWSVIQSKRISEFMNRDASKQARENLTRHSDEVLNRIDGTNTSAKLTLSHTLINESRYFILTLHEMTWRKQVNEQLALSDAIRTGMLESSSNAIIAINENSQIVEFNLRAEQLFGYQRPQALGQDMANLIIPQRLRDAHRKGMTHYAKTKEGPILRKVIEVVAQNSEGKEFPVELAVSPIETQDGTIFTAVMSDISERIRNTKKLEQAKDDADRANREKSRFLASMSHEIRTPLNVILGMVDLLQETSLNQQQKDFAVSAENAGRNLLDMINDILDISKIEAGKMDSKPQTFNPKVTFNETVELFQQRCVSKGLTLSIQVSDDLPDAIYNDPTFYRQIISNLMANAVNYTDQGTITARLVKKHIHGLVQLSAEIEDTGIGLDAEAQKQLFQDFTQVHQAHPKQTKGTGMGLVISRELANLCGGDITLKSAVGQGSTFAFQCPLQEVVPANVPQETLAPSTDTQPVTLDGAQILLVEDSDANRVIATAFLEGAGCEVYEALDGCEAIKAVQHRTFDAILMDMRMPNMGGIEAAEYIRTHKLAEHTPMIALTAHALVEVKDECLSAGMQDFLTKPIERKILLRTIAQWVSQTPSQLTQHSEQVVTNEDIIDNGLVLFDQRVIDQLIEDTNQNAASKMLHVFFKECAQRLTLINEAVNMNDIDALGLSAHALKSSSKTFGALHLSSIAEQIEHDCKANELENMTELVSQLNSAVDETKNTICAELVDWWQPE